MTKRNKSCESEVMLTMQRKELLKKSAIEAINLITINQTLK